MKAFPTILYLISQALKARKMVTDVLRRAQDPSKQANTWTPNRVKEDTVQPHYTEKENDAHSTLSNVFHLASSLGKMDVYRRENNSLKFITLEDIQKKLYKELGYTLSLLTEENRFLREENITLKQQVSESNQREEMLAQLNDMISRMYSITDKNALINTIPKSLCDTLHFNSAILWMVDARQQRLAPIAWSNISDDHIDRMFIPLDRQPYAKMLREQKSLYLVDDIHDAHSNQTLNHIRELRSLLDSEVIFMMPIFTNNTHDSWKNSMDENKTTTAILMAGQKKNTNIRAYKNILQKFADFAGRSIGNVNLYEFLHENYESFKQQAVTDGLTGLYNRRFFNQELDREVQRSYRHLLKMSLILLDVDHFKKYNDNNGHQAGDEVLKKVAAILRDNTRVCDMECRYGGEEFALILPETNKTQAKILAEKIRKTVESTHFESQEKQPSGNLTISLGIATFPDDSIKMEELIAKSDIALYKAKEQGRNCVVIYE